MVETRLAGSDEAAEIAAFMAEMFPKAKWSLETWRALLGARWCPDLSIAVTTRDRGRLVGCLGLVHARREIGGAQHVTVNVSSWYLNKDYRGQGLGRDMMAMAATDADLTATNFSSAPNAVPAVYAAGLEILEDTRLVWRRRGDSPLRARAPTEKDPWARLLSDHAGLPVTPMVFDTPDGPCLVVVSVKPLSDVARTHDVLHVSDRALAGRYMRQIADALLPNDADILSIDSRFVPDPSSADRSEPLAVPRFYKPGSLAPHDVDHLYSEIQLLDLKLY